MFSHPALLRELNQFADFLRRSGEAQWSRRILQASDELRRHGWTEAGAAPIRALQRGESGLDKLVFGEEHRRFLGSVAGFQRATEQLDAHRARLERLLELPTKVLASAPESGYTSQF
ncbi:MAG: hypothetical protein ACREKE_01500 [bacterium]